MKGIEERWIGNVGIDGNRMKMEKSKKLEESIPLKYQKLKEKSLS